MFACAAGPSAGHAAAQDAGRESARDASAAPDADRIIGQMVAVYAGCTSYRDAGRVQIRLPKGSAQRGREVAVRRPFKTDFVRGDRFAFSSVEGKHRVAGGSLVLAATGGDARLWWSQRGKVEEKPLAAAVQLASSVTSGAAGTVPRMLMPDRLRGRTIADLGDYTLVGEVELDRRPCYKLRAKHPTDPKDVHLWIDKQSKLLLQMKTTLREAEITVTYSPQINVSIDDEELEFSVPDSAGE